MQQSSNFMRLVQVWVLVPLLLVCAAAGEESLAADEVVLLDTNNVHAVEAGAASPALLRLDGPHRITSIKTYHWNGGRGAPGARFVIEDPQQGLTYGPWPCTGSAKKSGGHALYWECKPALRLEAGRYELRALAPATWSQNTASRQRGMCVIRGVRLGTQPSPGQDATAAEAKGTVGPAGGTVRLEDGTRVVFPAGSLRKSVPVRLRRLDPTRVLGAARAGRKIVLECDVRGEKLTAPAEVRIPLPRGFTKAHALDFRVGHLDQTSGVVTMTHPARIEVAGSQVELVAPVEHFSFIVLAFGAVVIGKTAALLADWKLDSKPLAPSSGPIRVPGYCQGQSTECLPTSVQMQTKAVNPDSAEVWRLMAASGIGQGGIPWGSIGARFFSGLGDAIEDRTGVDPEISIWQPLVVPNTTPLLGTLRRYIRGTIRNGIPVVLMSTAMQGGATSDGHAVILTGYDTTGFLGVDPRDKVGHRGCVTQPLSDKKLGLDWGLRSWFVTIAVPRSVEPERPRVTVNVPPMSVWFHGKRGSSGPIQMLEWHGGKTGGIAWRSHKSPPYSKEHPLVAWIPATATGMRIGGTTSPGTTGIEVINSDPRAEATVRVTLEILAESGSSSVLASRSAGATIPATERRFFPFALDLSEIRTPKAEGPEAFRAVATVFAGGARSDRASFGFVLEPTQQEEPVVVPAPPSELKTERGYWPNGKLEIVFTYYEAALEPPSGGLVPPTAVPVKHGRFRTFDREGALTQEGVFVHGQRHGPWVTNDGLSRGSYEKDKREGLWTTTFPNGKPREKGRYSAGQREGVWTTYFREGGVESETMYVAHRKSGPYRRLTRGGRVDREGRYEDDRAVGVWTNWSYDDKGRGTPRKVDMDE